MLSVQYDRDLGFLQLRMRHSRCIYEIIYPIPPLFLAFFTDNPGLGYRCEYPPVVESRRKQERNVPAELAAALAERRREIADRLHDPELVESRRTSFCNSCIISSKL